MQSLCHVSTAGLSAAGEEARMEEKKAGMRHRGKRDSEGKKRKNEGYVGVWGGRIDCGYFFL